MHSWSTNRALKCTNGGKIQEILTLEASISCYLSSGNLGTRFWEFRRTGASDLGPTIGLSKARHPKTELGVKNEMLGVFRKAFRQSLRLVEDMFELQTAVRSFEQFSKFANLVILMPVT